LQEFSLQFEQQLQHFFFLLFTEILCENTGRVCLQSTIAALSSRGSAAFTILCKSVHYSVSKKLQMSCRDRPMANQFKRAQHNEERCVCVQLSGAASDIFAFENDGVCDAGWTFSEPAPACSNSGYGPAGVTFQATFAPRQR
jgi:hypothetical protein